MSDFQIFALIIIVSAFFSLASLFFYHEWFGVSNRVDYKLMTAELEALREQIRQEFGQKQIRNTILRNFAQNGKKIVRQEVLPGMVYFVADAKSKMVKIGR